MIKKYLFTQPFGVIFLSTLTFIFAQSYSIPLSMRLLPDAPNCSSRRVAVGVQTLRFYSIPNQLDIPSLMGREGIHSTIDRLRGRLWYPGWAGSIELISYDEVDGTEWFSHAAALLLSLFWEGLHEMQNLPTATGPIRWSIVSHWYTGSRYFWWTFTWLRILLSKGYVVRGR